MVKALNKSLMDVHPRELKGMIKDIPTLPVIYQELFQKMQDPDISVPQIAEIIAIDQGLSAKVLHLVNSAFYGYSKEVKTISRAVVILGFKAVRSASLAISVFDFFGDEESTQIDMNQFWRHSIAVASTCKVLAAELRINQQEEAFIVGLLHDVGKLIEKRYFSQDFEELCQVAEEQHLSWFATENALFQIHHASIGKVIFRDWNFPPSVVDAVQFHHKPEASVKAPQLTALVNVADYMAYTLGHGAPGAYPPEDCSQAALDLLGLERDDLASFHEKISAEMEGAMDILQLLE